MFANPSRSCINYISPVISAFVIVEIYFVTPLACSRLREGSEIVEVPKIEKAPTRKCDETGERKGGANASALPLFPSPALIFSCAFYLRVISAI